MMVEPMPISTAASTPQPWTVALWPMVSDPLPDAAGIDVAHAVQDGAVLHVAVGADTDGVDVAADDGVHPDAGVLAEHDVADHLR